MAIQQKVDCLTIYPYQEVKREEFMSLYDVEYKFGTTILFAMTINNKGRVLLLVSCDTMQPVTSYMERRLASPNNPHCPERCYKEELLGVVSRQCKPSMSYISCLYIYLSSSRRAECDTKSNFKRTKAGLN